MKKRALLSLLEENEGLARQLGQEMAKAGLDVQAHFWNPDLAKMAWGQAARELAECQVWVIAGADFSAKDVRIGLSLTALSARAEHGGGLPVLISPASGTLDAASLPEALRNAEIVKSGLGVKAAVRANTAKPGPTGEYRLKPYALNELGLWFEIGPGRDPWQGAFFACGGSEKAVPNAHGVGQAGAIPERCTLRYPVQGMKLAIRDTDCEGWGVKNELTPATSYYVRVGACPEVLAFGAFPDTDEAEVYTVSLV